MPSFLRYLFLFFIIIVITWVEIPQNYQLQFPRQPGPKFDSQVRTLYIERLNAERPDVVLLGDSTLKDGVDPGKLTELTGRKVSSFDVGGSASAYWYLVLKNNIVESEFMPKYLVIIFRDTILTAPGYRVHGSYFSQLDEFARRKEPVLLERAYIHLMNPLERAAEQYFPLYGARVQIRQGMDSVIRYTLPRWLGCNKGCNDRSMYDVFTAADLEPGQLQNAIATAEQYLYTSRQLDFDRQVNNSFLPEMMRLTKENHIQLVLVRLKNHPGGIGSQESLAIKRYISDLTDYVQKQGVIFLDFRNDPRLKDEYYKDPLHLNDTGRGVFTQILAEELGRFTK